MTLRRAPTARTGEAGDLSAERVGPACGWQSLGTSQVPAAGWSEGS